MPPLPRLLPAVVFLAVLAAGSSALGQAAWYEGFEGGEATWTVAGGDVRYKMLDHRRADGAHTGQGCEWFCISADGGSTLNVAHQVGNPRVIDELLPSVWVKSDRPGLSFSASVVLPRTIDPATNRPLATVIGGTMYNDVGRWQQLRIADVSKQLAAQIRALHLRLGPNVDGREAYVQAVLLNIYGGPGATNVWIDDLDVAGFVAPNAPPTAQVVSPSPKFGGNASNDPAMVSPTAQFKRFDVKLTGSVLSVDDKPIFPRAIEHQGEPLGFLKQLGFNAVWLKQTPGREILEEADKLGLWLICPPPQTAQADGGDGSMMPIGPAFDRVLLWNLGNDLTTEQLPATRNLAEQVRIADRRAGRPLICKPLGDLRGFSRVSNNDMTLLVDRRPLFTTMELTDYGTWVRRQPWVALPGTPMWTTVQTQPNPSLREQLAAIDPSAPAPSSAPFEQMRLLTQTAVASGSRGLLFLSSTPLDATDPATQQRAKSLTLLNLNLALVEPWAAAGSFLTDADECSERRVGGTVLLAKRARLLLPIWSEPGSQCVPGQSAANNLWLKVPGVPESCTAFELTPGGLRDIPRLRVNGGLRVTFEEFSLTSQVLLAHDALIVNDLMRRSEYVGQGAGRIERDLAVGKYNAVLAVVKKLGDAGSSGKQVRTWFDSAAKAMQTCDAQLAARDNAAATQSADLAMRALRMIERLYWDEAVNNDSARKKGISTATSPAALGFETLPLHAKLIERINRSRGRSILPGGNFDDPNVLLTSGWKNLVGVSRESEDGAMVLRASADLVPQAALSGAMGLRLTATPAMPESPPSMIETPPVRFVSPDLPVEPGQLVCIHGWVNVKAPITGSVDGLMIYDNFGGEALAERIGQTAGWRQFILYRFATQPGGLNVTFSLTGLGEATIDDVGIEVLE
jgi:hypothetical protein